MSGHEDPWDDTMGFKDPIVASSYFYLNSCLAATASTNITVSCLFWSFEGLNHLKIIYLLGFQCYCSRNYRTLNHSDLLWLMPMNPLTYSLFGFCVFLISIQTMSMHTWGLLQLQKIEIIFSSALNWLLALPMKSLFICLFIIYCILPCSALENGSISSICLTSYFWPYRWKMLWRWMISTQMH